MEKESEQSHVQRVLSIQSHVVSGYVGNKAAVFPLQLLGFEVDVINSVHFSNHTGYAGGFRGDVLKGDQLLAILEGLEANDLLRDVRHILTGYIGSESYLKAVMDLISRTRQKGNVVRFVCDPVLGDKGRFYVPESMVRVYREQVLPVADVLTPNQFEVEQLTEKKISSIEDAVEACKILHNMGPELVFITSLELPEFEGEMAIIASSKQKTDGIIHVWQIDCPIVPGHFTGTGDLCASLLLAHSALQVSNLQAVMEKVINTMYAVIEKTNESVGTTVESRELKLIQSKRIIENPPLRFHAKKIK